MRHRILAAILLSLAIVAVACNRNRVSASSLEGQMGAAIANRCRPSASCTIRLIDVTPFKWDKMFYFDYGVQPAERQSVVGIHFDSQELRRQLLFLRDGKVVHNEMLPTDIRSRYRMRSLLKSTNTVVG